MMAGLGDHSLVLIETESQSTWTSQHLELQGKPGSSTDYTPLFSLFKTSKQKPKQTSGGWGKKKKRLVAGVPYWKLWCVIIYIHC